MSCNHDKKLEFTPKEVCDIFKKSYVTILKWLGERDKNGMYSSGSFIHAYKCDQCNKIFIPISDIEHKLDECRQKMKGV